MSVDVFRLPIVPSRCLKNWIILNEGVSNPQVKAGTPPVDSRHGLHHGRGEYCHSRTRNAQDAGCFASGKMCVKSQAASHSHVISVTGGNQKVMHPLDVVLGARGHWIKPRKPEKENGSAQRLSGQTA